MNRTPLKTTITKENIDIDSPVTSILSQIARNLNQAHRLLTPEKISTKKKSTTTKHIYFSSRKENSPPNLPVPKIPVQKQSQTFFETYPEKPKPTLTLTKKSIEDSPNPLLEQIASLSKTVQHLSHNVEKQNKENNKLRGDIELYKSSNNVAKIDDTIVATVAQKLENRNSIVLTFFGIIVTAIFIKLYFTEEQHIIDIY
jgi:ATP-dependent Lon protease